MKTFYTCLFLFLIIPTSISFAQERFEKNSDVLGVNLEMSKEAALANLKSKHNADEPKSLTTKLSIGHYTTPNIPVAIQCDVTPLDENNVEQFDKPHDVMTLSLDPTDSNKLIGLSRQRKFPKDKRPLLKVLVESFLHKYGKPTEAKNDSTSAIYAWSSSASTNYDCIFGASVFSRTDIQFSNILNSIHLEEKCKNCGTVMVLKFIPGEYVDEFELSLVNFQHAVSSFEKFRTNLLNDADKANKEKQSVDSKLIPNL